MEDEQTDKNIRKTTNSGRPFGLEFFIDMLEFQLDQTLEPGKPGRPQKKPGNVPDFYLTRRDIGFKPKVRLH